MSISLRKQYTNTNEVVKWISEYHVACVILLDTSGSMQGEAIEELNEGLRYFKRQASRNEQLGACVDIALVSFGGQTAEVVQNFCPLADWDPHLLRANGMTPMGAAIEKALDMITERKRIYKEYAVPYYRPWVVCITDGEPNDDWEAAAERLHEMESKRKVLGYCFGVKDYNLQIMTKIFNPKRCFELEGVDFIFLFDFLSNSLASTQSSRDGRSQVAMPDGIRYAVMGE